MTTPPLNYAIRKTNGELSGNLGWLFTICWLHANQNLRFWVGNETLATECGCVENTVRKHRDKLVEMKALVIVPYEKRLTSDEKSLHVRKYVYQITGVMQLSTGEVIPTVHFGNPESLNTHVATLNDLGFDTSLVFKAHGKPSKTEVLNPEKVEVLKPSKIEGEVTPVEVTPVEVTDSAPIAQPVAPEKPKPPERNAWYDAIQAVWGYEKGRNANMQKFLQGTCTGKATSKYVMYQLPVDSGLTPEKLILWGKSYRANDLKGNPNLNMLEDLEKLQSSILAWLRNQSTAKPKPVLSVVSGEKGFITDSASEGVIRYEKQKDSA